MQTEEALWAHVFSLVGLQMAMVKAVLLATPDPGKAREMLFQLEQQALALTNNLLGSASDPALKSRLQDRTSKLISGWFAAFHITGAKPEA